MTTAARFPWTAINALKRDVRGQVLTPESTDYEAVRRVWNGMIDTRPALIVRCATPADVITAVNFARANGARLSVRGGGHNVAGLALCEDGVTVDLSSMRAIVVQPDAKTARAEGGVTWGELDAATLKYGLATNGGMVSTTGIAGLTLGGGIGWQMARHGLTCDNLLSAEVVTANGRMLRVSATEHTDLFWALRGGGGNFGIVTAFEYQLHPMATFVGGMVLYPMSQARTVLSGYRQLATQAPDELTIHAGFLTTPDGNDVVAIIAAWFGAAEDARRHLDPVRQLGTPLADLLGPMSYTQLQTLFDPAAPAGLRRYWKSGYVPELSDAVIDVLITEAARKTSPFSIVLLLHMHGKATRIAPDATAFGARSPQWDIDILPQWHSPAEDQRHTEWARRFWSDLERFTRGVYSNHLDADDGAPRVRAAYGTNYDRLVAIKRKYDPDNFFNVNNNIPPTAERSAAPSPPEAV
jgi:FAD/FMN-containing dehydrogenase